MKIKIKQSNNKLLDPQEMFNTPHGTLFQQYFHNQECQDYYISCGLNETSLIHIWFDDECNEYRFSTDDAESLSGLVEEVKVKRVDNKKHV